MILLKHTFALFTLLLVSNIQRTVSGKLYDQIDRHETVINLNYEKNSASQRRNKIHHVLNEEQTFGEDDPQEKNRLDSSDLMDEGSIITTPDEETFSSGIHSINLLSKDTKDDKKKTTKDKGKGKSEKDKKPKDKEKNKNEISTGIDLKYLQELFQNKDIDSFQKNYTDNLKKEALDNLYKDLVANKKKVFEGLRNQDKLNKTSEDSAIRKIVEGERESERYNINFPLFYHAVGTITLPFDDLVEPFEAWYAGELNMSRIDYYQGMDKSYQRGDIGKYGVVVKVTPAHWSKKGDLSEANTLSCWYKEDSKWSNRRGQTIVPLNVKKFKFVGKSRFNGVPTYKFKYEKRFVDKNNTYTLHVTQSTPYKPIRYEMVGYDHLLRSHYDHYIIDYFSFEEWDFDYKVLQIPKEYKCYKQLEKMKSHFEANPMWEFLHGEHVEAREHELNKTYHNYQKKHKKSSKSDVETHKRKNIFRHNQRFIHSHNRAHLNYTLEVNHLSDVLDEEFEMLKGQSSPDTPELKKELNEIPQLRINIPKTLPKNLDWRDYGAVGPVHSQSFCASCWAFSAIGAIEGAFAIKNGSMEQLSIQQLLDCSWGYNNNGCRGGWSWRAFQFVKDHGIATRKSYGKYLGQEGYCHCGSKEHCDNVQKISYRTIEKHNAEKLKVALAMYGPGSIAVQCARKTFKFYSSGIYDDPKCTQKTDHAVLAIGYGEEENIPYWIIKNSWGKLWGDRGFMKISMKKDFCGVLSNGPLMVSVGGWSNETFPFQHMKRVVPSDSKKFDLQAKERNALFKENGAELTESDFFVIPDHVTAYVNESPKKPA
ncbi:counting factor associated protein D-like [Clytia hemisphaerica]|uniref:Uncharacterized protein n=1 Tax=Clytia hemisphaerica TaxID=252671 RepID=A0A7M5XBX3_9CNID